MRTGHTRPDEGSVKPEPEDLREVSAGTDVGATETPKEPSLGEMLAMDNADSVQFEPPRVGGEFPIPADLG
ncbi:MAG TPA: hypothetical protein VMD29_14645 [Terracidiphilus sp.]|nr:hypothetical protein [Terracidiphilus sp.]